MSFRSPRVLEAFDGSFFKGRFYARQPEAMIDVGNDREFGFLYQPDRPALESVFSRLFEHASCRLRRAQRSLQLAAFFKVLEQSEDAGLQMAVLERLSDGDPEVREAARALVSTSLDPEGCRERPAADRTAAIRARGLARGPRRRAAGDRQEQPAGGQSRNPGHDPQADRPARRPRRACCRFSNGRRSPTPRSLALLERGLAADESAAAARGDRGVARPPCSAGSARSFRNPRSTCFAAGVTDSSPAVRERTLARHQQPAVALVGASRDHALALGAGRRHPCPAPAGPDARRREDRLLEPARCARAPEAAAGRPRRARCASWRFRLSRGTGFSPAAGKDGQRQPLALARRVKALAADPALQVACAGAARSQTASTRPPWSPTSS